MDRVDIKLGANELHEFLEADRSLMAAMVCCISYSTVSSLSSNCSSSSPEFFSGPIGFKKADPD